MEHGMPSHQTHAKYEGHHGSTLCGFPADIDAIREEVGLLPIIEDAAHALGAKYGGYRIGTHSDYVCSAYKRLSILPR